MTACASAAYEIVPAHPPLPTAWNFPFHPAVGSHTSILMSESLDGAMVAATRQNSGRLAYTGGVVPAPRAPAARSRATPSRAAACPSIGAGPGAAAAGAAPPRNAAVGGVNAPAATTRAPVIVVLGSLTPVRLSHDVLPPAAV